VAVINDPGLNEIGRQIISEPGFRPGDDRSLRRAWEQWTQRATPVQRLAAEQVHFFEWLRGLHREHLREQDRGAGGGALLAAVAERPATVTGRVVEEAPGQGEEAVTPVSELKFRSESPEWQPPAPGRPAPEPAREPGPPRPAPPAPRREPPRRPEPVKVTRAAPVPQPSRKITWYQQMFPELAHPVATASGPKALAECDGSDLAYQRAEITRHEQALRSANATDEARIEDRERNNARDRVRVAEREQNLRDAQARKERLALAEKALQEHGATVIGELPAEALAACGFRRNVA
jgi:hypothetical protein